ncbi:MAG: ABC transporter permease, partial [Chloroflexota bacterium]
MIMWQYILRRLLISIPVLLAITALIFTLLQFVPGDPLDAYAPPDQPMPASQRIALRHALGLDQPPVIRYLYWL